MAFLDEMATLLVGSTVGGLPGSTTGTGWTIYKSHLPDSSTIPDKAIGLIETGGQGMMARVDVEQPGLQLVVRGDRMNSTTATPYATAQAKFTQARTALHAYSGSTATSGVHYAGIWCQNAAYFGEDENKRPQFVANFRVMRQTT